MQKYQCPQCEGREEVVNIAASYLQQNNSKYCWTIAGLSTTSEKVCEMWGNTGVLRDKNIAVINAAGKSNYYITR